MATRSTFPGPFEWDIPSFPEPEPPEDAAADGPPPPLIEPSERAASSFASDMRASLVALWESKRYGDVRLQARTGDEVLVHRLVISARCSYLGALLAEAPEGARLVVDAERDALHGILCFLYTDDLPPGASAEQLLSLRSQAQEWQLPVLDECCACALAAQLSVQTVCDILRACAREEAHARLALSAPRDSTQLLKQACGRFAARQFEQVSRVESFSLLPAPQQVWLFAQRSSHPLHCFAYGQNFMAPQELLQALLGPPFSCGVDERAPADPAGGIFAGTTPMQVALSRHNWMLCGLLLDAGASLQPAGGAHGGTLLHAAASAGDAQACAFLAQRGAALNAKDDQARSPLDCAVLGEHAGAASALKERGGCSTFSREGNSLLHQLASDGCDTQLALLLGNSDGADLPNAHGYTALHLAALHGKREAAEQLLLARADPNRMPAGGGPSPLHLAAKQLSPPLIELLLRHSAQLQAKMVPTGETSLHLCATHPASCALLLAEGALLEERDAGGFTPLQHAVWGVAPLLACRQLLQAGARVNTVDYVQKQTPLHRLCDRPGGEGFGETLALFLEHGTTVNLQDREGHTPLHLAAFRGHSELTLALVSCGASPNVPSVEGLCALSRVAPKTLRGGKAVPVSVQQQMLARIAQPPPWLPDQLAPLCQLCSAAFSSSNRRHHCRHCGRIACGDCSADKVAIPKFGVSKPTRVCTDCAPVLRSKSGMAPVVGSPWARTEPDTTAMAAHLDALLEKKEAPEPPPSPCAPSEATTNGDALAAAPAAAPPAPDPWSASPMPSPPRAGAAGGDDGAAADAIVAPLMTANPWGRPASLEANPFGDPAVMPRDGAAAEPSAANPFGLAASSGANNPFAADDDQLRGTLANLSDAVFDSPVLGQHPEGGS